MLRVLDTSPGLTRSVEELRHRVLDDPVRVLDPTTQHHEFKSGMHGRKLDFDRVERGTDFYKQWINTYVFWVREVYRYAMPEVLVGVANGANRLAEDMAPLLGVCAVKTEKTSNGLVVFPDKAKEEVQEKTKKRFLVIEDVGTTGSTTATVVDQLGDLGVSNVDIAHTWIRTQTLPALDERDRNYTTMIHEPLETFSPEDCLALPEGFCHKEVLLIPR